VKGIEVKNFGGMYALSWVYTGWRRGNACFLNG
jgi:hypothetical protein